MCSSDFKTKSRSGRGLSQLIHKALNGRKKQKVVFCCWTRVLCRQPVSPVSCVCVYSLPRCLCLGHTPPVGADWLLDLVGNGWWSRSCRGALWRCSCGFLPLTFWFWLRKKSGSFCWFPWNALWSVEGGWERSRKHGRAHTHAGCPHLCLLPSRRWSPGFTPHCFSREHLFACIDTSSSINRLE